MIDIVLAFSKHDCSIYQARKKAMWKIGLAGENTKKRGNKKSGESITPIRYNVIHMFIFASLLIIS